MGLKHPEAAVFQAILLEHNRPFAMMEIARLAMETFGDDDPEQIADQFNIGHQMEGVVYTTIDLTAFESDMIGDQDNDLTMAWEHYWGGKQISMGFDFMRVVAANKEAVLTVANEGKFATAIKRLKWI
jgi:hypothetical protein